MTWTINLTGHDDLTDEAKVGYEETVVLMTKTLLQNLKELEGGRITTATVSTNTTGSVDLLALT